MRTNFRSPLEGNLVSSLFSFTDRQRAIGQWSVGLFFVVTAFASLIGGSGVAGVVRGILSALLFLALAALSIPVTRARVFEVTGRRYESGELVFLIVAVMLVGVAVAPPP